MALIVEDGTSLSNADSYISVGDADTYHSSKGATLWMELTETEKEQALFRATEYMVGEYRSRWSGARTLATQSLDWPRTGVVVDDLPTVSVWPITFIPRDIKRACAELALKAAAGELIEDSEQQIIEDTIGPITTKYSEKPASKRYPQIESMLRVYLSNSGFTVKLVRT